MRYLLALILLTIQTKIVMGQEGDYPVLSKFKVQENEGKVLIDWSFNAGSFCDGVTILHSTDSTNFQSIFEIQGVCGSFEEEKNYYYLHEGPSKNKRNYYRLLFGGFNGTKTAGVQIWDLEKEKHLVLNNHLEKNLQIIFKNQTFKTQELMVYSLSGKKVLTEVTKEDVFNIDYSSLPTGRYQFFTRTENGISFKGSLFLFP